MQSHQWKPRHHDFSAVNTVSSYYTSPSPGLIVTIIYSAKYVKEEVAVEHANCDSRLCVGAIGNIIGLLSTISDKLCDEVGFIGVKVVLGFMRKLSTMWQRPSSCMCFEARFLSLWLD